VFYRNWKSPFTNKIVKRRIDDVEGPAVTFTNYHLYNYYWWYSLYVFVCAICLCIVSNLHFFISILISHAVPHHKFIGFFYFYVWKDVFDTSQFFSCAFLLFLMDLCGECWNGDCSLSLKLFRTEICYLEGCKLIEELKFIPNFTCKFKFRW